MLRVSLTAYIKKAGIITFCVMLAHAAQAQSMAADTDSAATPKVIKPLRRPEPGSDVDKLWVLYRDTNIVMIPAGDREVKAHVQILYNDETKKPYSVIAYGEADADTSRSMYKLVRDLGAEKLRSGYKQIPGLFPVTFNPGGSFENKFEVTLFQKGSQFAKYGIKKIIYNESKRDAAPQYVGDSFYFEVVDESRRPSNKPKKFVF